jgi:ATP-binding cassette subfamily F protein uup
MALISLNGVYLRFGDEYLFSDINLHLESGDRLCLLGRNGAGKSTLLKLMAGIIDADDGSISRSREIHIAYLDQNFAESFPGSALDYCMRRDESVPSSDGPDALERHTVVKFLHQLGIDEDADFNSLSGGGRRKVMLARVLAADPDMLLLDEPTNHLDIESISWLEEHLSRDARRTLVIITHDRNFARKISNRTAELDRGELFAFDCGYGEFLQRRQQLLEAEETARDRFDKRLAEEEAWLRRGIKARRTRNEGRVKALMNMREEHRRRRERQGSVRMAVAGAERSGDLVLECEDLTFSWTDQAEPLIEDFTTMIMRGDRIGIVGPNGSGKTTLIKLLMGDIPADAGTLRRGSNLQPLYFSQLRDSLDPDKSVVENLSDGDDSVLVDGKLRHVNAYLQDFLFSPDRLRSPVSILSGGERNRLLLAKLFTRPANLLILDEPTNDLDMETLGLLEDLLIDFQGTVLLVSHDREFLDNTVSDLIVFTADGSIEQFVGSYSEWRNRGTADSRAGRSSAGGPEKAKEASSSRTVQREKKLGFREKQELQDLPRRIEESEAKVAELHRQLADPDLYRSEGSRAGELTSELEDLESELARLYDRWSELEAIAEN